MWVWYRGKGSERLVWMRSGESVGFCTCAILLMKTMVIILKGFGSARALRVSDRRVNLFLYKT